MKKILLRKDSIKLNDKYNLLTRIFLSHVWDNFHNFLFMTREQHEILCFGWLFLFKVVVETLHYSVYIFWKFHNIHRKTSNSLKI